MSFRRKAFTLLLTGMVCALLCGAVATAEVQAADITMDCEITVSSNPEEAAHMLTGVLTRSWRHIHEGLSAPYVEIRTPEDTPAYGLYIQWGGVLHPGAVQTLQESTSGEMIWTPVSPYGQDGFAHEYIPLDGLTHFRFAPTRGALNEFCVTRVIVLGEGDLPPEIQIWQPPLDEADLMVIAAHPDDELIFMGGTLPDYAGQRGVPTQVVYMTCGLYERRSELLNGLWICGVRNYPVIGDFVDTPSSNLEQAETIWVRDEVNSFITEQLRRFRPLVVVTHDLDGEYGHGAHMLTADATLEAVEDLVWDDTCHPESAEKYGTYDVQKLYLHLYRENNLWMDWRQPLSAFGGKTALVIASEAFSQHLSQLSDAFRVTDQSDTSCASFGLAFTMVGEDTGADFMENTARE